MTSTSFVERKARPARRPDASPRRFELGQTVRLKGGFGMPAYAANIYHITAMLPSNGRSSQYRIRCDDERYERITTEDNLAAVTAGQAGDGASLIERTFGNG